MASSAAYKCGADEQTVDHVVLQCPIQRPPRGLHGLTVLNDETKGVTKRARGRNSTAVGAEYLRGAPNSPNNVAGTFFNTVYLLPKDVGFEHGDAELVPCPGRHLTSLRPWLLIIGSLCWK